MRLFDVNVLVHAFRRDSERHDSYRGWLLDLMEREGAFAISEQVLSAVVRVTTHPKVFRHPSAMDEALDYVNALRTHPACRLVQPSSGHWAIFSRLCRVAGARGNLVTDAWFAALAIDSGCTWMTADRDFARFPGLRWRHPLDHDHDLENPV